MSQKIKKQRQKLVHKCTNYKQKPSKVKAMKDVVLDTFNGQYVRYIVDAISERLNMKENWAVVLKGLVLVHACFEEASTDFEDYMKTNGANLFQLTRFKNFCPQNHPLTIYITKYGRYLEEKVNVLKSIGFQFEKKKELDNPTFSDAFKYLPKLQSQFNALCNCRITNIQRASPLIIRSYIVLLKDSIILYGILSKIIVFLLDKFGDMNKKEAVQFVNIYKLFVKETNAIIKIYDGARSISSNLPNIEPIEESMIAKLEECVQGISNDGENNSTVLVDDVPEELLGTTKGGGGLNFNSGTYTNQKSGKSEDSSESSSPDDEAEDNGKNDFFNFLLGAPPISNSSKSFNKSENINKNGTNGSNNEKSNSNGSDPFALFSGNQTSNNNTTFNPFEVKSTTNNNNNSIDFFSKPQSQGNTNTGGGFNPFLDYNTNTTTNISTGPYNPFDGSFSSNTTNNTSTTSSNPFLQ